VARIFVVGAGVVGTAVGRGFVEAGHSVTLVDLSPARVDALVAAGLDATTRLDLRGEPSSFVFLTVPTPAGPQGYDLRDMAIASRDVGRAIGQAHAERGLAGRHSNRRDARGEGEGYAVHTVVTRSTVPPGTTTQLVGPAVAQASGTAEGAGFVLAANPEFLRGASAEDDARWPWMTVVGARSRRVGERLAALLEPFGGDLRVFDKPETAELVKCAHNLYNATKISFWNEMWLVAQALGLDPDDIAGTVSRSAEGSLNPAYGIRGGAPFSGRCLPKDTDGFLAFARELGLPMPLLDSVVGVNRDLAARVDSELEAMSHGAGRVLDLREAERRDAMAADEHVRSGRTSTRTWARGREEGPARPETYRGAAGHGEGPARPEADRGAAGHGDGRAVPETYRGAPGHREGPAVPEGYRSVPGHGEPAGGSFGHEPPFAGDTAFVQDRGFGQDRGYGQERTFGPDRAVERTAEFVQDRPAGYDPASGHDSGFGPGARPGYDSGYGWDGEPGWDGRPTVPGARDPLSGDLPTVRPTGRDPFTGDPFAGGPDDQPYDGRDGRDERW
jgi:UDPglucose 6-dehydrogenase